MGLLNHCDHRTVADLASNKKVTAGFLGATLGVSVVLLGATPALAVDSAFTSTTPSVSASPVLEHSESAFLAVSQGTETSQPGQASQEASAPQSEPTAQQKPQSTASAQAAAPTQAAVSADAAAQEIGSVVYNACEGSLAGDGALAHGTEISATDTATGASMDSGWNNNTAILDLTKSGPAIDGHVKIANDSNERLKVEEIVLLHRFGKTDEQLADQCRPDVVVDEGRVQNDSLSLGLDNEEIRYSVKAGEYKTLAELRAAHPDFSWSQVIAIMSVGYLNPGSSVDAMIPLTIANYDSIKSQVESLAQGNGSDELASSGSRFFDLGAYAYYWRGADFRTIPAAGSSVAVGAPYTSLMDSIRQMTRGEAHWDATVMTVDKNGTRVYDPAPKEVQDALKPLAYSDFEFTNRGVVSDVLYTDGQFDIKLENAFNSIKDLGYTVNVLPDGSDIWPYYSYTTRGNDGSVIHSNGVIYLQVSQVFDTKDLTLDQPGPWRPTDNLVSAQIERYHQGSMRLTGTSNLKDSGDYDFELFDAHHQLVASGHGDQPVERLAPGEYQVCYSYAINPTHKVTKTASITVADPSATDPSTRPEGPHDNPREPDSPASPADPTAPKTPSADPAAEKLLHSQAEQAPEAPAKSEVGPGDAVQVGVATSASRTQSHAIPRLGDQGSSTANTASVQGTGVAAFLGIAIAAASAARARLRRRD